MPPEDRAPDAAPVHHWWRRPDSARRLSGPQQQAEEDLHASLHAPHAAKRERPGDGLLSALIAVRDYDDALTENELVSTAFLLMFAGRKTTAYLIGSTPSTTCCPIPRGCGPLPGRTRS
ncbi:cytochrome P450 [Streptomyces tricolor]|nr:cytochrome P450 [Streptomyces tricolor]